PTMTSAYARLCLPLLSALMLTHGRIDPRRFTPQTFSDPNIIALASKLEIVRDDNPNPNALAPQRIVVHRTDGTTIERQVPNVLGHPAAPMTAAQVDAKRELCRELATAGFDERLFSEPLSYFSHGDA
ncbi:MAG TPA: hypothetical protein VIU34_17705, partial [Steroidobacter sp.]